jgi:hypothetical protein
VKRRRGREAAVRRLTRPLLRGSGIAKGKFESCQPHSESFAIPMDAADHVEGSYRLRTAHSQKPGVVDSIDFQRRLSMHRSRPAVPRTLAVTSSPTTSAARLRVSASSARTSSRASPTCPTPAKSWPGSNAKWRQAETPSPRSCASWWGRWSTIVLAGLTNRSAADDRGRVRSHLRPKFEAMTLEAITLPAVMARVDELAQSELAPRPNVTFWGCCPGSSPGASSAAWRPSTRFA